MLKFYDMWRLLWIATLFFILSCSKNVKVKKIDFICEECGVGEVPTAVKESKSTKEDYPSQNMQGPLIVEYESLKDELNVRTYEEMFYKALDFYLRGDIELAGKVFDVLAKNSPNQQYKEIALFNLAISLERMGNDTEAERIYSELGKSDIYEIRADSYLRLARIKVSRGEEFGFDDSVAKDRERASFLKALEVLQDTEKTLSEVITFTSTVPGQSRYFDKLKLLKKASLELKVWRKIPEIQAVLALCDGNIKFIEASLIPNYPPKRVEEKAKLLIEAQKEYFSVVRSDELWWVTAGVFKLGETYRYLFENLIYSTYPPELKTEEEKAVYKEELMKELRKALKLAKDIYEKNINFAARIKLKNVWISKSERELKKIEEYISQIEELLSKENKDAEEKTD